jgi:hypothetical protein
LVFFSRRVFRKKSGSIEATKRLELIDSKRPRHPTKSQSGLHVHATISSYNRNKYIV